MVGKQHVAGELILDETGIGRVAVERTDNVIAVGPGVGSGLVFVVTVRFAVVNHIEPMPRPPFAVARGTEQSIHHSFIRVRAVVRQELPYLLRRGRQPGQIKAQPSNQGHAVGFAGGRQAFGLQFCQDKLIDRIPGPMPIFHGRNRRAPRRFERPMIALGLDHSLLRPHRHASKREQRQE